MAWRELASILQELNPTSIMGYGYLGQPADTVIRIGQAVCFAAFVLEKDAEITASETPNVILDLPLSWPEELANAVKLWPADHLDHLVPLNRK